MRKTLLLLLLVTPAFASESPNYHWVGWANAFVPGAGQWLLGDPGMGAAQAGLEAGAFGWGYSLSDRTRLTLDGSGEVVPLQPTGGGAATLNLSKELNADFLQEFGLKLHMVDVFNAYRQAAAGANPRIDDTPTSDLFLAPFHTSNLEDPAVAIALGVTATAVLGGYWAQVNSGVARSVRLTPGSNRQYAATYVGVYPVGSGAPEEMFYRGFLQNEAYSWVDSPYFSVSFSTLLFALSHAPADMPTAAISGAFLGWVSDRDGGRLSHAIAYHFWSDVLTGIYAVAVLQKSQFYPGNHQLFKFSWNF